MDRLERQILALAWALAYAIVWAAAGVALFRLGVAALWGSGTDIGLVAAVGLSAAGVLGLGYLAVAMIRDWRRRFSRDGNG